MLKNVLKSARRKAAFGVENMNSAYGRWRDERRLKNAYKKPNANEIIADVSKNNKERLTRLKAIDYYSK